MKKHTWLKVMASTVTVVLAALVMAGCGNSNSSSSSSKGSSTTDNKKVEITFWHGMNGPYQKAINSIIADFNKSQSKYVVKGTAQGNYTALQQKIMAAAKSRNLPTISQTTYTTVPDYSKSNLIEPLDNYMLQGSDKLSSSDLKDIYPAFLKSSKYEGKYYSIPFSKSTRILYYNQAILDKYGIAKPKTWDDIVAAGNKLKADGIYGMGFDRSWDMEFEGLARQAGNPLIAPGTLKVNLNTADTLEAANLIQNMVKNKIAKTAGADNYFTQGFIQGKAAFYAGSSAGVTQMVAQAPKTLKWGTMPLPSYKGKKATEIAGNDIVMFKSASADQKKGAWQFMKFLLSSKETAKWAMATGYVPLRKSAMDDTDFKQYLKDKPYNQAAVDSLDDGFQSTAFLGFSEYRNDLLEAVDQMITKNADPKATLTKLQATTENIIKTNKQ
ncbi:ABC transporter substrate-binding protein [Schleiferilactobacillus harbinensis]|uniref:ABC transporter substrate-binding protein n=1 Tax=Schleiferilactobacillus harbinensis TaxID=304207 RepID=UPI0012392F19|nr:ABC transporter substrate-binding protein [Schleiferilactobacillus harbinensis]QEU46115.1 ABC transporter substrate-binding protein [Schleiferilactobacillus harbinensis]